MNTCLHCGQPVKNKFCNVSCQNYYQKKGKKISEDSLIKRLETNQKKWVTISTKCFICNSQLDLKQYNNQHPNKDKYFCSRKCSNTFSSNVNKDERLKKISLSMKDNPKVIEASKKAGEANRKLFELF